MSSFSEKVLNTSLCQVLAYVVPRFYQKTGIEVHFKAYIDKSNNEFKIDIGFTDMDSPEIYDKFLQELKEAEKIVQNHGILNTLHKYKLMI